MKFGIGDIIVEYEWAMLYYSDLDTDIGLAALSEIIKTLEKSLKKNRAEFDGMIQSMSEVDPENQSSYYQHMFQMEEWILDQIEIRQRNNNVLSIYAFLEEQLNTLCSDIYKEFRFKLMAKDLSGSDILMRYWNYLIKVYEISPNEKLSQSFNTIKQNKVYKNIISHNGGSVSAEKVDKLPKSPGLEISKFKIILKDDEFLNYLIVFIKTFFKELYKAVDERYKVLKPGPPVL